MRKLLQGVIDFHERIRPGIKDTFARLALGQAPDALFIACSDSRVAANVFASTDPGDLFVVRNVGNIIPPCGGQPGAGEAAAAAMEFALANLNVRNIIVCGHSECGAMQALLTGVRMAECNHLNTWLRHGAPALERLNAGDGRNLGVAAPQNCLSQLNVLLQLEHLRSYPIVRQRLDDGSLKLHGWWFDIGNAEVSAYVASERRFVVVNEDTGRVLLENL